jgi:hypothetical protein
MRPEARSACERRAVRPGVSGHVRTMNRTLRILIEISFHLRSTLVHTKSKSHKVKEVRAGV